MERRTMRKLLRLGMLTLILLLGILPAAAGNAYAAGTAVKVTSWQALRDALQSPQVTEVEVEAGVTIDYTFDGTVQSPEDVQISVAGQKVLTLNGNIIFRNSVGDPGLVCLWTQDTDLTVQGNGGFSYVLDSWVSGATCYIEEGDLFFLTGGTLTVKGSVSLNVNYATIDVAGKEWHQAVITGLRGTVNMQGGYIGGNTIYSEGLDWTIDDCYFECGYGEYDLVLRSGSALIRSGCFVNGIGGSTGRIRLADGGVWIGADGTVSETPVTGSAGMVCIPCFVNQKPAMPQGQHYQDLGTIARGQSLVVGFQTNGTPPIPVDWGLRMTRQMWIVNDAGKTVYTQNSGDDYDLSALDAGTYRIYQTIWFMKGEEYVHFYQDSFKIQVLPTPVSQVTLTGLWGTGKVPGQTAVQTEGINIASAKWYSVGGSLLTPMYANETMLRGQKYTLVVELAPDANHVLTPYCAVTVNGRTMIRSGENTYCLTVTAGAFTDYVDVDGIMRPAPGAKPDFTAGIESAYTNFGEVQWYLADSRGEKTGTALSDTDVFREDTRYRLEVTLSTPSGYEFDLTQRGGYLNGDKAGYYYPVSGDYTKVTIWVVYDTANCISRIDGYGLQYPIVGKTPNADLYDDSTLYRKEAVEWYYETNPGTASAGFAKLTGNFKGENRRHRVYVSLAAAEGCWFATDHNGHSMVEGVICSGTIDFSYPLDDLDNDGACTTLELSRTFALAKDTGSVFLDGVELKDGWYLESYGMDITTEKPEDGYAYYHDGKLILDGFVNSTRGNYNAIDTFGDVTMELIGENNIMSDAFGISAGGELTVGGSGELTVESNGYGIFTLSDVTVNSGTVTVWDQGYSGIWILNQRDESLTLNGGRLSVWGDVYGIEGDDELPIYVNGGVLEVSGENAIAYAKVIGSGLKVLVSPYVDGEAAAAWDGTTALGEYAYVKIQGPAPAGACDVSNYRSGGTYTYPARDGYVFAGWYTDPALTQPLGKDVTEGYAYPKYVDERVLSIKWQVTSGTTAGTPSTTLRLVTTVDSLNYSSVGFRFRLGTGKWNTRTTTTVYSQIKSNTAGVVFNYKPTVFHETSKYFLTRTVTGVPSSYYDTPWTVVPFWVTLDGTPVDGVNRTFKISDYYNR